MKKMFSKVVFFCAFILLTSIISIDVNAEENIITEMSGEAESLETESIEKEPEETEEISEESEQKNDPLIEEQQTESTNNHGIWDDDPIDETFNFTSISQESSTLVSFNGKCEVKVTGEQGYYPVNIEFTVGNYTGSGKTSLYHHEGVINESLDFDIYFPKQKDNAVLKVKLIYIDGTYIEEIFTLKNKPPLKIMLHKDFNNYSYLFSLDVKLEDLSINSYYDVDVELKIGGDTYNSTHLLNFYNKDQDNFLLLTDRTYKPGEKFKITLTNYDGFYAEYNGNVKDYGSDHFRVELNNDIFETSEEIRYSITNNLKNDIWEYDDYDIALVLDGTKYEYSAQINNGKKQVYKFDLGYALKKTGTAYTLSVTSKNLGITKTIKGVIKHDKKLDKIYKVVSDTLYDDETSFSLYLKPTSFYDEDIFDYKVTIIVTIDGEKFTYRRDPYNILDADDGRVFSPLKVKLGEYYKDGTPYTIEIKGETTGFYSKLSKEVEHSDMPPALIIDHDKVTYHDQYIKGETDERASVVLKIGKKTYKKKSNSRGKFKFKIKQLKIGTKIKITATSPINGNRITRTWKVKKPKMSIKVPNYVTKDSRTISGTLKGAKKGDYIVANINGKKYKGKINYKKNQFSINVSNLSVGNTTLTVYNKFKQKIVSHNEHIYLSNSIYVGMTTDQVLQTTFGRPSTINRYNSGALEQWVYRYSYRTTYIYVQNGVVTSFSEIG